MNTIKELWIKKNSSQGRINITLFFINIFLLMFHAVLMWVYISVKHKFMIGVNAVSIFMYASSIFFCFKKPKIYVPLSFIEIWIHMLCGVMSFGWTPCFQNWTFALVAAYFLPSLSVDNNHKNHKLSFLFAGILIFTYFFISVFIHTVNLKTLVPLDDFYNRLLFTLNNASSFFSIVMFSVLYTSRSHRKERELSRKADYDQLTNLYNRHAFNQMSNYIIEEVKENKGHYNVAILDIDFFKKVNDTYGHNAGDLVLKQFADILKSLSNKDIVVGRWGGEEFVIITSDIITFNNFNVMLEKLRKRISKYKFKIDTKKFINITTSIGSACIKDYSILETSIKKADDNLYKAKKTGRNKLVH